MNESALPSQNSELLSRTPRAYVYRHTVSFEETNVVGNVYYARHVAWQGRCREMFLRERVPQIIDDLAGNLRFVTLRVSCEYYHELRAFDELEIVMCLAHQHAHRIGLSFEYDLLRENNPILVARGFQEIACMRAGPAGSPPPLFRRLWPMRYKNTVRHHPVQSRPLPPDLARSDNDCPRKKLRCDHSRRDGTHVVPNVLGKREPTRFSEARSTM